MFNNCRQYNEEGSEIVRDANTLERRLYMKTKELGIVTGPVGRVQAVGRRSTPNIKSRVALGEKARWAQIP